MRRAVLLDAAPGRGALRALLQGAGYEVDSAADVGDAMQLVSTEPDLLVIDLTAAGEASSIVREVRRHADIPVLVVVDPSGETQGVEALNLGADDFVRAPVSTAEVSARAEAIIRRAHRAGRERQVAVGPVAIDLDAHIVTLDGAEVTLTPMEYGLLEYLIRRAGMVVTVPDLLRHVWGSSAEWQDAHTVAEHVRRLRQKLGREWIKTVRGAGYRLERRRPGDGHPTATEPSR
jgi:DNA-binding response OmpR family regulator